MPGSLVGVSFDDPEEQAAMAPHTDRPTWLRSDRVLARSVAQPVQRFLHIEAAGGILLVAAALVALVWANSPWSAAYRDLWTAELSVDLAGHLVTEDLRHWINDGLMTLFFFVLGLEIKEELTTGQLAKLRNAIVPAAGALGGILVPALIYLAFNLGRPGVDGWGSPSPPTWPSPSVSSRCSATECLPG